MSLLITYKDEAIFVKIDVENTDDCKRMVEETVKHFGRLEIAVNNAGISGNAAYPGHAQTPMMEKLMENFDDSDFFHP